MKIRFVSPPVLAILLAFGIAVVGCDNTLPGSGIVPRHVPEITQFVIGMALADSNVNFGFQGKTTFNKGDLFSYGLRAQDSLGDWKQLVHSVKYTNQNYDISWDLNNSFPEVESFDRSWDFPNEFKNRERIEVERSYILEKAGIYKMTWHIVDRAGNTSNAIIGTIIVN
jgi:hypothetical protein